MKKRLVSLLLTVVLGIACVLPAFAVGGFDFNTVRNGADIRIVSEDEAKGFHFYLLKSFFKTADNYHVCSDNVLVAICPFLYGYGTYGGLGIGLAYCYRPNAYPSGLYINELTLTVGDTSYTFSELPSTELPVDSDMESKLEGWDVRCAYIALDAGSLEVLDSLVKNRDGEIVANVKAADGSNWSFHLSKTEKDGDVHMYNLFAQAGGLTKENMAFLPAGSATQCKITKN